jgi:LL-diaminopimelate aminotransferase
VDIPQAQRLQRIPPYPFREINALKNKMISEGVEPIDFGIGDPDMPTPDFVIEALAEAAKDPSTHPYDETGFGIPEYKDAIARFTQRRFGVEVCPEGEIQSCIGSKESLVHIIWAYVDPSDVVLVPDPAYSVYKVQTTWCGGAPFPMPLLPGNGFLPDLNAIPRSVAKAAKLLFLNYPNNPTGAVASLDYLAEAVEFCRQHEIILVNDCAYSEVAYDGLQPPSVLQVPGAKDVAIEMHSLSKTFNMTGWRVGWAVGGKPFALDRYEEWVPVMQGEYQRRRDAFVAGLNSLGWNLEPPQATFYVWVPVPPGYDSASFATDLLKRCKVLAIPGAVYGEHGEGFVRFSLTIKGQDKQAQISEAITAMRENLKLAW